MAACWCNLEMSYGVSDIVLEWTSDYVGIIDDPFRQMQNSIGGRESLWQREVQVHAVKRISNKA